MLKRTRSEKSSGETLKEPEIISNESRICTIYGKGPHRFRATLPKGEYIFNHELAMDLLWLKGDPALHIVDIQTHFSAAMFLQGRTVEDIWNAFVFCWASAYVGNPDKFRVGQESTFLSSEFRMLSKKAGIEVNLSETTRIVRLVWVKVSRASSPDIPQDHRGGTAVG